ncbi:MAG: hypothetical protein CL946_13470 [Ectothiorhodospiraceae bacterium]|nr:hypothetical protein [Ectothiorhodospiraceae bacterium]
MKTAVLITFTALFLTGCEQQVADPDWPPFEEKLVVTGYAELLESDSLYISCQVGRTLPLDQPHDYHDYDVLDAEVHASGMTGGAKVLPVFDGGVYRRQVDFDTSVGKRVRIDVEWENYHCWGEAELDFTTVAVDTMYFLPTQYSPYMIAVFRPLKNRSVIYKIYTQVYDEFYGRWVWFNNHTYPSRWYSYEFTELSDGAVQLRTYMPSGSTIDSVRTRITILSEAYYTMQQDDDNQFNDFGPFAPEEPSRKFNIQGEGIGYFWYQISGDWVTRPFK